MAYSVPHFISGKVLSQTDAPSHHIYNPAIGEVVGNVHFASKDLCDKAVSSAKQAWASWSETTPIKRAQIFFNFRDLLEKNRYELAAMVTREHGKTLEDAQGSIARAIEVVEVHCGLLTQFQGTYSANVSSQIDTYTFRQPIGVCAGISPFNFPVMVPVWMMIPAIAAGNTFILKPSEQDPSAPIRLLELLTQAGLPDGVVNCVQGDKKTVDHLLAHPDIVAFTAVASTPVARSIYTQATSLGKRAHTFGSAKNHCVVMPDADLTLAANSIVGAAFGSAGERCMAISVVVVVGAETADNLLAELTPKIKAIRIQPGDHPQSDMGPLVSRAHQERVIGAVDKGVEEGATLLIDGRLFRHAEHPQGYYLGPCLFDNVTEAMSVYQNEVFGPVLVIVRVPQFEDALNLVNRNQYGNGTAIFTRDGFTAREYSQRVQAGMVGINIPIPVPVASHSFGGWKQSSFGDSNMHGLESLHFYTKRKTVTCKWPVTDLCEGQFSMPTHR